MPLLSGFARAEITPAGPVRMGGYAARQGASTGVHDPLYARALALRDGGNEWVLAVLDLVGLDRRDAERLQQRVADAAGLRPQDITLACTHTHSGPQTLGGFIPGMPPVEEEYLEWLAEPVGAAVAQARSRYEPATVRWARGRVEGVASDRRGGSRQAAEAGELDVLLVGGTMLVCFACHPTVLGSGNREISADLPGTTLDYIERHLGVGYIFMQGAAGNLSTRLTRRGQGFDEVRRLGERLGRAAVDLAGRAQEIPSCGLDAEHGTLELPRRRLPDPDTVRRRVEECRHGLGQASGPAELKGAQTALEGALIEEALAESAAGVDLLCPISAVCAGGAAFVAVPGELFSDLGIRIRAGSPLSPTCIVGYAGGYVGYLPGAANYDPGDYESSSSPFEPGAGDLVVEEALRLLAALDRRRKL